MGLNSVAFDIMTYLGANAFGTIGQNLFSFEWGVGDGADQEVDAQVVVIDEPAIDALIKDEYENPVVMIKVRGNKLESGNAVYARARDIYEFMIQSPRVTINTVEYVQFAPVGGLQRVGRDRNNRFVYDMSFFTYRNSI